MATFKLLDPMTVRFHPWRRSVISRQDMPVGFGTLRYLKDRLGAAHLADGAMSADEILDFCGQLADLGVDHIIFGLPNVQDIEPLQRFGEEIIPKAAKL